MYVSFAYVNNCRGDSCLSCHPLLAVRISVPYVQALVGLSIMLQLACSLTRR